MMSGASKRAPSKHVKRSVEFEAQIDEAIVFIQRLKKEAQNVEEDFYRKRPEDIEMLNKLLNIIIKNTTDSACVVKAALDEPIFTLRGQDRLSAALVMTWAQLHDEVISDRAFRVGEAAFVSYRDDEKEGQKAYEAAVKAAYEGTSRSQDAMECASDMARFRNRSFPT